MRHLCSLTVQLASTFALLGAAVLGCATGTPGPAGGNTTSSGGDIDTGNQGDPGTGDPGTDNPGTGDPGEPGDDPGSGGQGGAGTGPQGGGGAGAGGPGGDPGSPGGNMGQGVFKAPNAWTKNVSELPKSPESDAITTWLDQAGGWGSGQMRIDFGLTVLEANAETPKLQFTPTLEFYSPDCDEVPFPVPPGGSIEAESGYSCDGDGDCHLLVVHKDENKLYEMWRAHIVGNNFQGGCAAVWDLTKTYPDNLRGEGCTSADAGGFPITAMVFTPEEVAAGTIEHALRFILPNARIRKNVYVHPGTHSTFATSGGANAPPYGVRFRLRKDYPLESLPSDAARVIAKAIQEYGMFLADGGTIALTGGTDKYSAVTWADLDVDSYSLSAIKVTDMEVVDMGTPISWSGSCVRN